MSYDEEMQNRANDSKSGEMSDEKAYRLVFNALGKEPVVDVAPGLADRVILRLQERKAARKASSDWIFAVGGGIVFLAGLIITIVVTGFKPDFGFLNEIADFKGIFIFGAVFIILINILDKQLMRKKRII
jgi:hypothetical protein